MYQGRTIAVVVPAYNEELLIYQTIMGIPQYVDKIIAVDDASIDRTLENLRKLEKIMPARLMVLNHIVNQGVGAAIATGYEKAMEYAFEVVAVMAGDGQMHPDDLPRILDPVIANKADYSKGNRFIIPYWKYTGNIILSFFTRILTGYKVSDTQSGYTAINLETLKKLDVDTIYPRYGMPNDMLFKLSKIRARVQDVYTRPVYHIGEKTGIRLRSVVPKITWLFMRQIWQKTSH